MIEREARGDVAILRLAHGKASALDLELCDALDAALRAEADAPQKAVVLTGTGAIFCAGVDLKRVVDGGAAYVAAFLPALDRALASLFFLEKPAVAALNGHAIAGGAVLALACDVRILARGKGMLGTPELQVGVPFPFLALEIVRAALGDALAAELALRGKSHNGEECKARGMIDELVAPEALLPRALECAAQLAAVEAGAFALTKRWLRRPSKERVERARAESEPAVLAAWQSAATLAAIESYVARTLRR